MQKCVNVKQSVACSESECTKVFQSVLNVYQYVCPAVCIPLCAIIFGAGSRSLELQLQAFPPRLPMMNVDVHHRRHYVLSFQKNKQLRHDHNYDCGGQVGLGL